MPTKTELDAHLVKRGGVYHITFVDLKGVRHTRTTKMTTLEAAREVLETSRLVEIETAARAGVLTAEGLTAIMAGRKVTCELALAEWVTWRSNAAAPNTVRTQELCLRQFLKRIDAMKWPVNRLTFELLDDFVNAKDDPTGASNRSIRVASLRSFFTLLTAKAYYVGNPAAMVEVRMNNLSHEQKEKIPRVPFSEREFRHVVAHTTGFWNAAVRLAYWAGLRLTDIACMEWASVSPDEVIVWTRKTHTRVALPVSDPLLGGGDLRCLFFELMEHNRDKEYVFPEERETALDPAKRAKHSVYFSRQLSALGIEGKSFHCLRHSFATRLDKAGKTIEDIGRVMGHSPKGAEVTKGYIHH
jgi:integrase